MGTDIHPFAEVFKDGRWHLADVELPNARNYIAFAILADVRNSDGFAGRKTHEPIAPISSPRYLPYDISEELQSKLENREANIGYHDISWVTLEELMNYDLDQPILRYKTISIKEIERYQNDPSVQQISVDRDTNEAQICWIEPLREYAWLITGFIEALSPLGLPSQVRMVFGFDS